MWIEVAEHIAVFFHLIGFAALFGVSAVQVRTPVRIARNGMMHGALTQLVSGIILVALNISEVNHIAAGIKLLIVGIIIGILAYYRRDKERIIPARPFFIVFGLIFIEVLIAILWIES